MDSEPYTNELGTTVWRDRAGERHRIDGPAVEHADGSEEWYQRGVLHRVGGPAVYAAEGFTAWYQHGQLHREDGPARQWAFEEQGQAEYWLHGQRLSREQWREQATSDRMSYIGEDADGAQRSAWIDRNEADTLDLDDPRHSQLLDSALRWEAQAERLARTEGREPPASQWNAAAVRDLQSSGAVPRPSPWHPAARRDNLRRETPQEPARGERGLQRD